MRQSPPGGIMLMVSTHRTSVGWQGGTSMSAERNKALVRRFLEAHAKGELDAVDEMLAPDFVDHNLIPGQQPAREGYLRGLTEFHAAYSHTRYVIEKQLAEGEEVVTTFAVSSTHDRGEWMGLVPTGKEFKALLILVHRVVGGKIAEEWTQGSGLAELTQRRLEQEMRERERVEQEMRVARSIQQGSLPEGVPTLGGVAAASDSSPGEALALANEALYARIPPNMFVTCFYAILDPKSATLTYANAGHELPYLHRDGAAEELRAKGMPLGMMPGMSYEEGEVSLAEDECVLFHSDGLV